jgi:hypothetical protein
MKRIIALLFMFGLVLGLCSVPELASASGGVTVVQSIKDRKDDNGWARDTFIRTAKIVGSGHHYTVTITDSGTFQTVKGQPSPNAGAATVSRSLPGTFSGGGTFAVTGSIKSSSALEALPDVFDDSDGTHITTGNWFKQFFNHGATSPGITAWKWLYSTDDEQMTQEDGKAIVGDITGKLTSHLMGASKCRVSKSDKRNVWTVKNIKGDRSRDFKVWVRYNGKYSPTQHGTVAAGSSVEITTPNGGRLTVVWYNGYSQQLRQYSWSKASITC